jgi:hypothetical protein
MQSLSGLFSVIVKLWLWSASHGEIVFARGLAIPNGGREEGESSSYVRYTGERMM